MIGLILLLCVFSPLYATPTPEQVHLSFHGDMTNMAVTWTTMEPDTPMVYYGQKGSTLSQTAVGTTTSWTFDVTTRFDHRALMTDLTPGTEYSYRINSRSFNFKTLQSNPSTYKVCIFGDLGLYHGNSTQSIITNGLAGMFDFIIHVGDISYDLHANDGKTGDEYMNQLEPLVSTMPYMVIAGNHEDDGKNFTNYQRRFWMPENGFQDNQFYSFDLGPIHWVGVSTENYGFYYEYGTEPVTTQYNWLEQDLKTANSNRVTVPWIISYQHRPFYCSNVNSAECQSFENRLVRTGWLDMPGLEPLFAQYSMDMGFWGHEHSYERFYPVVDRMFWNGSDCYHNPKAPVYIVTGSAGCHSGEATFTSDPWAWSAARNNDYGYTIMTVANLTHIHLQQISINKNEETVDDFWVSKDPSHVHTPAMRTETPGFSFPPIKCHMKDIRCMKSLQQLNVEL